MLFQERKHFTFVSQGLPEDTFTVVRFRGTEVISRPYEFDITLSSEDPDIDLKDLLQNPATLTILRGDDKYPIHGMPCQFEQLHELKRRVFYRAVLAPRLWQAGLYRENQLFLDKTVPEIIEEILKQAGLRSQDYEFKLTRSYPSWEYICQYQESDLNFISRWMEREGIYYFFEQTEDVEKLIITDSLTAHQEIKGEKTIFYSPPSGLLPAEEEVVKVFVCRQRVLPKKVILKDYNYRKPSLDLRVEAEVDPKGRGETYIYGEHFKDPGEGQDLAKIRAEELLCRETEFQGEATAPALAPGFLFELADHFRNSHNRKYLVIEVQHQGMQTGLQLAGLEAKQTEGEKEPGYSNRFTCIPSDVQFRPERRTPKSKFHGSMNAVVDAAGDGQFAELDDQGRYKVLLPFDLSGRSNGKASRFIRMVQPYSGFTSTDGAKQASGMHFPLHKGAEVLLTFVDGDPDRPIISGAIPNPETTSPVVNQNQTKSVIRDNYGNELIFDSSSGNEHISLYSPHHRSGIQIGKSIFFESKSDSGEIAAGAKTEVFGGIKSETVLGINSEMSIGWDASYKFTDDIECIKGTSTKVRLGPDYEISYVDKIRQTEKDLMHLAEGDVIIESEGGNSKLFLTSGEQRESIVDMGEKALRLSIGDGKKRGQFASRELTEETIKKYVYTAGSLHAINAAIAIRNYLAMAFNENWKQESADHLQTISSVLCHIPTMTLIREAKKLVEKLYTEQIDPDQVKDEIEKSGTDPKAWIEMLKSGEVSINSKKDTAISSSRNIKLDANNGEIQISTKSLKGKGPVELGNGALKITAPPPPPKKPRKPFGGVDALTGGSKLSPASKELAKKLKRR